MMKFALALILFLSVGCQTIYFERNSTEVADTVGSAWHHGGGIFGLFEWSPPFDPTATCGKQWQAVMIEHSFPTAFVSAVVPWGIYTPWAVGARCGKGM